MGDEESTGDFLICGVCHNIADNAVACTTCWDIFCESCVNNLTDIVCPRPSCLTQPMNTNPDKFARQLISKIKGGCPFQCGQRMRPEEFPFHMMRCARARDDVAEMPLTNLAFDTEELLSHLSCQVCYLLTTEPVLCSACHKIFCTKCTTQMQLKRCPGCSARADHKPAHLARRMIGAMEVTCPNNGCGRKTTPSQLADHLFSCQFSTSFVTGSSNTEYELHQRRRRNQEFDKQKTTDDLAKPQNPEVSDAQLQQGRNKNGTWKKVAIGLAVAGGFIIVVVVAVKVGPILFAIPIVRAALPVIRQVFICLINILPSAIAILYKIWKQWRKNKSGGTKQDDKGVKDKTAGTVKNYSENTITFSLVTHNYAKDK